MRAVMEQLRAWKSNVPSYLLGYGTPDACSTLQKAIIIEASHPACFQKKKKKRTEITVKLKRFRNI